MENRLVFCRKTMLEIVSEQFQKRWLKRTRKGKIMRTRMLKRAR